MILIKSNIDNPQFLILEGDAIDSLQEIPDNTIHCVVTSPPYYAVRDYKVQPTNWKDGES